MYPIVLLCGKKGSGKSTVAEIVQKHQSNVAVIAFADPVKRICHRILEIPSSTLWGESAKREVVDPSKSAANEIFWRRARKNIEKQLKEEYIPGFSQEKQYLDWLEDLRKKSEKGLSPRTALQVLGTDFVRKASPNAWVYLANSTAKALIEQPGRKYNPVKGIEEDENSVCDMVVIADGRFRNEITSVTSSGGKAWRIERNSIKVTDQHQSEVEMDQIPSYFFDAVFYNNRSKSDLEIDVRVALKDLRPKTYGARVDREIRQRNPDKNGSTLHYDKRLS